MMYRVSNAIRSTHSQDGAIVLDVERGQMFRLNLVGSRILEILKVGCTESALVDQIIREFEVDRDTAEKDVRGFIGALKERHLLKDGY